VKEDTVDHAPITVGKLLEEEGIEDIDLVRQLLVLHPEVIKRNSGSNLHVNISKHALSGADTYLRPYSIRVSLRNSPSSSRLKSLRVNETALLPLKGYTSILGG
jgi:hypothetical protein